MINNKEEKKDCSTCRYKGRKWYQQPCRPCIEEDIRYSLWEEKSVLIDRPCMMGAFDWCTICGKKIPFLSFLSICEECK